MVTRRKVTNRVRRIITNRCPTLKVRQGRVTGRSNLHIRGRGRRESLTKSEVACVKRAFPMWGLESGLLMGSDVRPFIKKFQR